LKGNAVDQPCVKGANTPMPHELIKLICKLRWIGMEKEALRIQIALGMRPSRNDETAAGRPIGIDWQGLKQRTRLEPVFNGSL
jgi:hypothetical protein